ncbi:MAG: hypothetical protein L6Q92_01235 [Phycisphaerae bacterium]|nr:hypothetical protein [Phycisphaerae bacterium]
MDRRTRRWLRWTSLAVTCIGTVSAMSCVTRVGELMLNGLTIGGITGLFGLASPAAAQVGAGIDLVTDVVRWLR